MHWPSGQGYRIRASSFARWAGLRTAAYRRALPETGQSGRGPICDIARANSHVWKWGACRPATYGLAFSAETTGVGRRPSRVSVTSGASENLSHGLQSNPIEAPRALTRLSHEGKVQCTGSFGLDPSGKRPSIKHAVNDTDAAIRKELRQLNTRERHDARSVHQIFAVTSEAAGGKKQIYNRVAKLNGQFLQGVIAASNIFARASSMDPTSSRISLVETLLVG